MNIKQLRVHPAQMRTRISAEELGRLVKQVLAGFDPSLPLLVMDDGTVLSGHRRWLAAMVAHLTPEGADISQVISALCEPDKDGWIALSEALHQRLVNSIDQLNLPVRVWEGEYEIMTLIRANMGPEAPDILGQARCFKAGLAQGLTAEQLAEAAGLPMAQVKAMARIPSLPKFWRGLLQNGRLSLDIVPDLLETSNLALNGMCHAIQTWDSDQAKRGSVQHNISGWVMLTLLRGKEGPPHPDRKTHFPHEFNTWSAICKLWEKAAVAHTSRLWESLLPPVFRGYMNPQSGAHWLELLRKVPGLEDYFNPIGEQGHRPGQGELSARALGEFIRDANCNTCVFSELPPDRLRYELDVPCRQGKGQPDEGACWHWAPKDQPFYFRLPWGWLVNSGKEVYSISELIKAWDQERKVEMKRPTALALKEQIEEGSRPIEAQREAIRHFMATHDKAPFTADHPWATTCARCRYRLEESPVKADPNAPHCQWAKLLQRLKFEVRLPKVQGHQPIPFCFQFRPAQEWAELLPDAGEAPLPRELMYAAIERMGNQANKDVYDTSCRGVVQFLTGRPERATGNHRGHFKALFLEQRDSLSDGQLWTLYKWVFFEWLRVADFSSTYSMVPYPDGLVECGLHDYSWAFDEGVQDSTEEVDNGQDE